MPVRSVLAREDRLETGAALPLDTAHALESGRVLSARVRPYSSHCHGRIRQTRKAHCQRTTHRDPVAATSHRSLRSLLRAIVHDDPEGSGKYEGDMRKFTAISPRVILQIT